MSSIGGYFELELNSTSVYHIGALKFNTARNALRFLLQKNPCSKIYLPFYTCEVIIEAVKKTNTPFAFYNINIDLEPDFDLSIVKDDECFLYTNYFGLKDDFIKKLSSRCSKLIIDNSQSFYSMPLPNIPTFYTARKFFGVADGAYLYADVPVLEHNKLGESTSYERINSLLKRIDLSAEEGYPDFLSSERIIDNLPIEKMSRLTDKMLGSIDYDRISETRIQNFAYLSNALDGHNKFNVNWNRSQVPMVYPFLTEAPNLYRKLIDNRIYTATYWSSVLKYVNTQSVEFFLTNHFVFLPVDQRYSIADMDRIIKTLK